MSATYFSTCTARGGGLRKISDLGSHFSCRLISLMARSAPFYQTWWLVRAGGNVLGCTISWRHRFCQTQTHTHAPVAASGRNPSSSPRPRHTFNVFQQHSSSSSSSHPLFLLLLYSSSSLPPFLSSFSTTSPPPSHLISFSFPPLFPCSPLPPPLPPPPPPLLFSFSSLPLPHSPPTPFTSLSSFLFSLSFHSQALLPFPSLGLYLHHLALRPSQAEEHKKRWPGRLEPIRSKAGVVEFDGSLAHAAAREGRRVTGSDALLAALVFPRAQQPQLLPDSGAGQRV